MGSVRKGETLDVLKSLCNNMHRPHLPLTALESPSSQQEPDVTVLSWTGRFFLLLVTMETSHLGVR